MKKLLLIVVFLLFSGFCMAQYRLNKEVYDTCKYSYQMGDPYNPTIMAFSSALIPGVGQIIEGESVRGFGFLGGFLSLVLIRRITVFGHYYSDLNYTQRDIIRWCTIVGRNGLRVWSAFDAAHVAKVNNLAFKAKYGSETGIIVFPYPDLPGQNLVNNCKTFGITLIVSF
jgi:hypothetical protein